MPTVIYDTAALALAKPSDIKAAREAVEEMPVQCDDGTIFDADDRSEKRMVDAIAFWNNIGQAAIDWRLADNTTKTINLGQLQNYLAEVKRKRAVRGFQVYQEYRAFRQQQGLTLRDLENWKDSHRV